MNYRHRRRLSALFREKALHDLVPSPDGNPTQVFTSVDAYSSKIASNNEFWVLLRVSGREQLTHIIGQMVVICEALNRLGYLVCGITIEQSPGWYRPRRSKLMECFNEARKLKVPVIAESVCRYIRNISFTTTNAPNAIPSVEELDWLTELADGVDLLTLVPPEATPSTIKSRETTRGHRQKEVFADKKLLRKIFLPHIQNLRRYGRSTRSIADAVGINESTIRGWFE